ncbi:hypothetical protein J2S41_004005 [Catenuloplanes atrovinosus]|uniref:Uncharacterized protein n=1 Tax=Catenuloplanes atrovinosus TaxID=137266 RepID=A0AAE4CAP1_9ACTN|nr:hypothetical protein [Catenuloplanes atrovinosus]
MHVPLAMPALWPLAILLFLLIWNQFLLAIVLVDDPAKRTMADALGAFQGQWGTEIPLLCADTAARADLLEADVVHPNRAGSSPGSPREPPGSSIQPGGLTP